MRKFLIIVLLFSSCASSKLIIPQGNYPVTPLVFSSEKPFEKVWDNLIDVFAQKGLSVRIIDKSSGLIISGKSELEATIEDKSNNLVNPNAYIVIPYFMQFNKRIPITNPNAGAYSTKEQLKANPVYGDWNVRIKQTGTGSTINVNITNISYDYYDSKTKQTLNKGINVYKSTGVFEKQLVDLIK